MASISKGLPKSWSDVKWNPPVHRAASGAYIGDRNGDGIGDDDDGTVVRGGRRVENRYRSDVMGGDSFLQRKELKGVLFQHLMYADSEYTYAETSDYKGGSGLDGNRYGFRFHYNPSTIEHGIGVNGTNIVPAIIMSGAGQSMPITPPGDGANGASIRFQLFLNRIEDMQLLSKANGKMRLPDEATLRYFYGNSKMVENDLQQIWIRGTGYDLEFLFRTLLGRPWRTLLRGDTADVGIAFGVPLILDFSAGAAPMQVPHSQRYLGRVSAVSYTHLSFNSRMVPMWTQVAIDFVRYPDVLPKGLNQGQKAEAARYAAQCTEPTLRDPDFTYSQYSGYNVVQPSDSVSGPGAFPRNPDGSATYNPFGGLVVPQP